MLEHINESLGAETLSSIPPQEIGTVTVPERPVKLAAIKDERGLKVAMRDAMRHLSAVEAMQRLSSCRIFQAGMRLSQIREYLERTDRGAWCKWQKHNGLSRSTCNEAIRLFEEATTKWGDDASNKLKELAPTVAKKLLGIYPSVRLPSLKERTEEAKRAVAAIIAAEKIDVGWDVPNPPLRREMEDYFEKKAPALSGAGIPAAHQHGVSNDVAVTKNPGGESPGGTADARMTSPATEDIAPSPSSTVSKEVFLERINGDEPFAELRPEQLFGEAFKRLGARPDEERYVSLIKVLIIAARYLRALDISKRLKEIERPARGKRRSRGDLLGGGLRRALSVMAHVKVPLMPTFVER